jgi:hypothetical protein
MIVFQGVSGILAQGIWPKAAKFMVLGASLLVATLSWKFVEQPFRDRRFTLSGQVVFRIAATSVLALLVLGASALATHGFPSRFPPEAVRVASFLENADPVTESEYRVGTCFLTSRNLQAAFDPSVCLRQDPTKRNELLIGDSHAAQLWYGLSSVFTDVNLMQATASGCKPTLDQGLGADKRCRLMMDYVFHDYLRLHHIDAILIAARWDAADLPRLERTVAWLKQQGIAIVLFGPTVQYDSALPRLLALAIQKNNPRIPAEHRVAYYERLDKEMSQLAESKLQVRYISYFKLLCQHDACLEYAADGVPLQSDYGHLTGGGSSLMAAKIRDSGVLK